MLRLMGVHILFLIAGSSQSSLKMRIKLGKQSVEKAKIELGGAVSGNLILFPFTEANCSLALNHVGVEPPRRFFALSISIYLAH